MKRIYSLTILLFIAGALLAQNARTKRAKEQMANLDYTGAIETLSGALDKDSGNNEAKLLIAESYRKVGDSENAEYWYGQVVQLPEATSLTKLYYGWALQR
ncbi:MAG: flagellar motor protein MotB, partial [Saprospiraceae bacterium]